mmetsp:Transcript_16113/g.52694  ORF Transcript_16113/g.52694 Transcript_16113/m.52694 type:complete len:304 (+) Transcript_16113:925-1836(+)
MIWFILPRVHMVGSYTYPCYYPRSLSIRSAPSAHVWLLPKLGLTRYSVVLVPVMPVTCEDSGERACTGDCASTYESSVETSDCASNSSIPTPSTPSPAAAAHALPPPAAAAPTPWATPSNPESISSDAMMPSNASMCQLSTRSFASVRDKLLDRMSSWFVSSWTVTSGPEAREWRGDTRAGCLGDWFGGVVSSSVLLTRRRCSRSAHVRSRKASCDVSFPPSDSSIAIGVLEDSFAPSLLWATSGSSPSCTKDLRRFLACLGSGDGKGTMCSYDPAPPPPPLPPCSSPKLLPDERTLMRIAIC